MRSFILFAIDVLVCERCQGPRRILGAVTTDPHAVRRVRVALGLAAEPPPGWRVPAAEPPSIPPKLGATVPVCLPTRRGGFRARRSDLPPPWLGR